MTRGFTIQSHCATGEPEPTGVVRTALQWFDRGWSESWRGRCAGERTGPVEGALLCRNGNVVPLDFRKPMDRELVHITVGVIALALGPTKELPSWSCEGDDSTGRRVVVRGASLEEASSRLTAALA